MPFTFAHPVAVMPWWNKTTLPVSALIIGCMSPDFEYFVRFRAAGVWSHHGAGIVFFNLPMILMLFLLFETVVRPALYDYLPGRFPYRWRREGAIPASFKGWFTVAVLGLAGTGTHLIWDQFTHKGAWLVNHISFLGGTITAGSLEVPVYKAAQHGSTLIGLIGTAWWIHRHLRVPAEERSRVSSAPFWFTVLVLFVLIFAIAAVFVVDGKGLALLSQLVVPAISSLMLAVLLACLFFGKSVSRTGRS
ncbi:MULTISPECIES: DUF4184 family protein [unclassified Paenibacillus]|uniref:DUF4184 family protein n=1 Tax=unclassified Paenibacillus TaxID=185978 RepID=UPI00020D7AFD|nr:MULTISPECIES: DUF4184 family protein [unclassified Paenibacillus]EGL14948.1 hypothetical protein HMPREF9413_1262 [Paenibacillus sp. HGF7]EPD92533.1 hypothetical protein HMPREF1207_00304 [Paenibacillus sp. HGH0039]